MSCGDLGSLAVSTDNISSSKYAVDLCYMTDECNVIQVVDGNMYRPMKALPYSTTSAANETHYINNFYHKSKSILSDQE